MMPSHGEAPAGAFSHLYAAGPSGALQLMEPPPEPLNESELSWIWAGQRFPPDALRLVDGGPVRVVQPGRAGGGAGPDYLDAVLELNGEVVLGDVELHVRASAFRAHGHARDPAYDGVALHVVFRADDGPETCLSNGRRVPVAAFAPWLEGRVQEIETWLQAQALWQEPCRDAVGRLGEAAVRDILDTAGLARLQAKAADLQAEMTTNGPEDAAWRALLRLSGVGGDREGFRRLADAFPHALAAGLTRDLPTAEAESHLTACLAAVAGLAPSPHGARLPPPIQPRLAAAGRPANHPSRRLAGAAALFSRCGGDFAGFMLGATAESAEAEDLMRRFVVAGSGAPTGKGDAAPALIGPDRAREIAVNLALPLAMTRPALAAHAVALARGLRPGPAYGKTGFLEANLRPGPTRRIVGTAVEQQGLLAYLESWCSRGGCGHCELSPRPGRGEIAGRAVSQTSSRPQGTSFRKQEGFC